MCAVSSQQVERETYLAQANSAELVERIARAVPADGSAEPLPGLHLHRVSAPRGPMHGVLNPAFCVIAQGSKEVFLGDTQYQYDPDHYLLVTVGLPITSQVVAASPERPYLSLRLDLDLALLGSMVVETEQAARHSRSDALAMAVSSLDGSLLDAVVRLVRLADSPAEAGFLTPLITREILYRLLLGEQGDLLRRIAVEGGHTNLVVKAIGRLRDEYDRPLRIDDLARASGMSVSGFHHHFKAVTGMSPLQYQKRHRLQEARRLMLGEHLDAATTAFRVGYEDAAHFNREYKRLFGAPPMRDVERLRAAAVPSRPLAAD
jgi:AraC-like DNA-binding protein